jgi:hypothetical protein
MNNAQLTAPQEALAFILGGNSTVTVVSGKTGARYTFKVRMAENKELYFVSLLTGADNEGDFSYMGIMSKQQVGSRNDGSTMMTFRTTAKSKLTEESTPVKAFRYVTNALLYQQQMPANVEVWHEGKCGRCGRKLTVPTSISSGFGPECIQKVGLAA